LIIIFTIHQPFDITMLIRATNRQLFQAISSTFRSTSKNSTSRLHSKPIQTCSSTFKNTSIAKLINSEEPLLLRRINKSVFSSRICAAFAQRIVLDLLMCNSQDDDGT
jgi:hypothetical protein